MRVSHLGYEQHSLVLPGLPITIIGQDAKYLGAGRDGYYGDYQYSDERSAAAAAGARCDPRQRRDPDQPGRHRPGGEPGPADRPAAQGHQPRPCSHSTIGSSATSTGSDTHGRVRRHAHRGARLPAGRPEPPDRRRAQPAHRRARTRSTLDLQGNVVNNFTGTTGAGATYADGSEIRQAFPGKLYQATEARCDEIRNRDYAPTDAPRPSVAALATGPWPLAVLVASLR